MVSTTEQAVLALRTNLGLSQREFAARLKTTTETISRWETGQRKPAMGALERLAVVAQEARLKDLRTFFVRKEVEGIVSRVRSSRSLGSERHVALKELKYWSAYLRETYHTITKVLSQDSKYSDRQAAHEYLKAALQNAAFVMDHVRDRAELYIDEREKADSERQQEDREILKWGYRQDRFVKSEPDE